MSQEEKDRLASRICEALAVLLSTETEKVTGISTATLTAWKQGAYEPKVEKIMLIADFFGVPVEVFLDAKNGG